MTLETALEVGLMALVTWPIVRTLAAASFRRAFPRTAMAMAAAWMIYLVTILVLAASYPAALRPLAALAMLLLGFAAWYGRGAAGAASNLPPGSLSLAPFAYLRDPYYLQKQAARYGRTFKVNQFGRGAGPSLWPRLWQPVVCVLGLDRAATHLRQLDEYLMPPAPPFNRFIPKGYLRYMAPQEHAHYRRIFQAAIQPSVVDANMPLIDRHLRTRLPLIANELTRHGAQPETILLETAFGWFMQLFFGVDQQDALLPRLRRLYERIDITNEDDEDVEDALSQLKRLLLEQYRTDTNNPQPHPAIPCFLGEIARNDGTALEDITVVRNMIYLAQASWIDFSGLLAWLFKRYCDERTWALRLQQETRTPELPASERLSTRFVMETLRLHQSEYIYRLVLQDISFDGFRVPRGWLLRFCVRENHRDPLVFENPDTFNPDRFLHRQPRRTEYSPFGASRISCLGVHLTQQLARLFVERLAECYTCSTVRDGPAEFRRWHWKPSSRFRAHMTEVAPRFEAETASA